MRLRIGQLSPYYGLFDDAMPPSFRQDRAEAASNIHSLLSLFGEVVFPGLIDSDVAGSAAGHQFADARVDVVVFAPTMAAPPSYLSAALKRLPDIPIIALTAQELTAVPDGYDTEEATRQSLPVGAAMGTNVLFRQNRPFIAVAGALGDPNLDEELAKSLSAAGAAAAVRRMRLGAFGEPIPGYLDVVANEQQLSRLGVDLVKVSRQDLDVAFAAVDEVQVQDGIAEARDRYDATAVTDEVLGRSVRLSAALKHLCESREFGAATVNCHGEFFRDNPNVGITACLALSELSEQGCPVSCTGDLPTAIALAVGRSLAGTSLYCELYQLDVDGDWLLVANGGEGDPTIRGPESDVRLLPEDHYLGEAGPGTAVAFAIREGSATLISLSPRDDPEAPWVLVSAEGSILGSRHDRMEGPNAMFRFDSDDVTTAFSRWCRAGATHHAALLPGRHRDGLAMVADLLSVEHRAI